MTWLRARALPLAGILCLVGQGILLYAAGKSAETPVLPWPVLFLLLTIGLALVLAFAGRISIQVADRRLRLFWHSLSLLAVATLLGVGLAFVLLGGDEPAETPDHSADLDQAVAMVARIEPALDRWWRQAEPRLAAANTNSASARIPVRGGDLFRRLAPLPGLWPTADVPVPMGVILWQGTERLAWSGVVEPLAAPQASGPAPEPPAWARSLDRGRQGWILRQVIPLDSGRSLEVQLRLTVADADQIAPGVDVVVGPINDPALTMDDSGLLIRQVGFGPGDSSPYMHLLARPESAAVRRGEVRARWLLVALLAWGAALLGLTRLGLGPGWGVVALWLGRGLLAAGDSLRWLGVAYPDQLFPAAPDSWFSLVDPAYFATTFAWGWFASTADAVLTAVVVAVTVWYLLDRRRLVGRNQEDDGPGAETPRWARGLVGSVVFGLICGAALSALASLACLIAENANPRLIGTGVSLKLLSFWGLQVVLMVLALALLAAVAGLAGGRSWPTRTRVAGWLLRGLVAGAVALALVGVLTGSSWWLLRLLAAGVAGGLWLVAPALWAQPRFLRRFGWPLIMVLAACCNYASLRSVYDVA